MEKINTILKCTNVERKISFFLFLFFIFFIACYLGLVFKTVIDVSFHKEAESRIAKLQYNVSELESEYIKRKNGINQKFVKSNGFEKSNEKTYISSTYSSTGSLASKNE